MKVSEQPTGIDLVRAAVYASDAAKQKIADQEEVVAKKRADLESAEAVLRKLRSEHADAERRLADLIASGSCALHHHAAPPVAVPQHANEGETNEVSKPKDVKPVVALEDQAVPIKWRIACMLLADPNLNYQETAARLWGPLDATTSKNRVNAHVQELRRLGIVETLGSNRFRINATKLAKLSGLPVVEVG